MREIDFEEVKRLQVDILAAVDKFCEQNNIRYSLSSGTLIGAIRHNGYIPWDDDIDLMMPRADYDRFISTFNGVVEHLSVMAPELNANYYAPYANVYDNRTHLNEGCNGHRGIEIGVKIDIFPIDTVPADDREYAIKMKKIDKLNSIMRTKRLVNISELKKSFFSNLAIYFKKSIYACLPYTYLQKKIRSIATDKSCAASNCVDNVVYNIYSKKCTKFNESVMNEYIRLPFEGHLFCAVKDYDTVLKKMYGDYMQLPPEEKRVPVHGFKAYWRED